MPAPPRIVVVGAGAVGSVYAFHLSRMGAEVSFYVRPKRRDEAAAGTALRHVSIFGRRRASRFVPSSVVTSAEEVAALAPDEIWVATDTEALEGDWLGPVLAAAPSATVVCLQPGARAGEIFRAHVPNERLVFGLIGMISWKSPLDGSTDPREAGPPAYSVFLDTSRFSGPRAAAIVERLRAGGCPAKLDGNAPWVVARSTAMLIPLIAALEVTGWSLRRFAGSDVVPVGVGAVNEMIAVAAKERSMRVPLLSRLVPAFLLRLGARILPWVAPFDVETYLRVHFTKVGEQTTSLLREAIAGAKKLAFPHARLDVLVARLEASRGDHRSPSAASVSSESARSTSGT